MALLQVAQLVLIVLFIAAHLQLVYCCFLNHLSLVACKILNDVVCDKKINLYYTV